MSRATTRAAVLAGVFAALLLTLNLIIGSFFTYVLRIPGGSGFVTGLTVPFGLCLVALMTKRFGTVTLTWLLYSIVAIPLALMGPPNPYKPLIGLVGGLTYDLIVLLLRRSAPSYYLAMVGYTLVLMASFYLAYELLDLPNAETFYKVIMVITAVFIVEGFGATWVALWFYKTRISGSSLDAFFRHQAN